MSDLAPSSVKTYTGFRTPQFALSIFLTAGLFGLFWRMLTHPIPPGSDSTIYLMVGQYMTVWAATVGYFVWTTYSSSKKTDIIAKANPIDVEQRT